MSVPGGSADQRQLTSTRFLVRWILSTRGCCVVSWWSRLCCLGPAHPPSKQLRQTSRPAGSSCPRLSQPRSHQLLAPLTSRHTQGGMYYVPYSRSIACSPHGRHVDGLAEGRDLAGRSVSSSAWLRWTRKNRLTGRLHMRAGHIEDL